MGRLDEKVAIVTGGGSGIGKAIARSLAAEGAKIVLAGRSIERLVRAAQEIGASGATVVPIPTDVTDEVQVNSLFERTMDLFHRVDILVNNAGATDGAPLSEMSVEMWDKVIATNLKGPFLCTRSAMRIMKSQGSGRILNIGSISAQRPRLNSAPYASKQVWSCRDLLSSPRWKDANTGSPPAVYIPEMFGWRVPLKRLGLSAGSLGIPLNP